MTRTKLLGSTLSAIALFTLAGPPAFAGGGMGGGPGTTACRTIGNGVNPPQVVRLDVDTLADAQEVQVGPPLLLCALPTTGSTVNNAPQTVAVVDFTHIVCYPVSGANKEKHSATITDPFTLSTSNLSQAVTLSGVSLLCLGALVENITPE